jgi:hypothetical protein
VWEPKNLLKPIQSRVKGREFRDFAATGMLPAHRPLASQESVAIKDLAHDALILPGTQVIAGMCRDLTDSLPFIGGMITSQYK